MVSRAEILQDIHAERERQDETWGEQNHADPFWAVILGEEYGEVCRAVFEHEKESRFFKCAEPGSCDFLAELRAELIQTAAVCVAWVEAIDRR